MEMRFLGNSGLKVSALAFGTMTFGGKGHFRQVGSVQVEDARRHVDLCLEASARIEVLGEIAGEHDATIAQAALNWGLRKPGVTSVIVGARTEEQLTDNLATASWELTEEEVRRLDEVSATPPIYPFWHQRRFNSERIPRDVGAGASR